MLVGPLARLRIAGMSDASYIRELRNSPRIMRWFQHRRFITDLAQQKFMESLATSQDRMLFIAELVATGQPFGVYMLQDIDHRNQLASWGIFLDETVPETAIASVEAAVMLFEYAFGYLNIRKLVAEVLPGNDRAMRYNVGLGLELECTRRKHLYYDGEFHDLHLLAMFREDFEQRPTAVVRSVRRRLASAGDSPDAPPVAEG